MKILKFYANWCVPCKKLDQVLTGFDTVPIEKINIEERSDYVQKYQIRNVPTLILVDSEGQELKRFQRVISKEDLSTRLQTFFENNREH